MSSLSLVAVDCANKILSYSKGCPVEVEVMSDEGDDDDDEKGDHDAGDDDDESGGDDDDELWTCFSNDVMFGHHASGNV